jgi:hypothetical protein
VTQRSLFRPCANSVPLTNGSMLLGGYLMIACTGGSNILIANRTLAKVTLAGFNPFGPARLVEDMTAS